MSTTMALTAADIGRVAGVRSVGVESAAQLAAITADAFRDDPFNNWLFTQQRYKHKMFAAMARYLYTRRGFCQLLSEGSEDLAATMWLLPGAVSTPPLRALLPTVAAFAADDGLAGIRRGLAVGKAMEAHHPSESHAYLFTVGVAAEGRGRGLGRRLLEPVLSACDRRSTAVYLENSNPANTALYNSLGFERIAMIEPVAGCPPLEAMRRAPSR